MSKICTKISLSVYLISFLCFSNLGTTQHNIQFEFSEYDNDTIVIGYYIGERTLVHDTIISVEPGSGKFEMKSDESLDQGVYMILTQPQNEYVQFLVGADQEFYLKARTSSLVEMEYTGSEENEIFTDYLSFVSQKRAEAEPLRNYINRADSLSLTVDNEKRALEAIDKSVAQEQQRILNNYPDYLVSNLIKANLNVEIPDFEGTTEEANQKRYVYYKKHFFDHIELENPISIRTPYFHNKVTNYIDKLTPMNPDSVSLAIDSLLKWMEPAPESYRYYLSHFINQYANAKTIGMDAVFIHLADNYYAKGKAQWTDEETLTKIKDEADKIRPTLIGKTAPNIKIYKEDGSPIAIDDIDYEYLVLLFWAPDCGHCKKAMPDIVEFEEKYRSKGVRVLAVCTKHQEKTKDCWKILEEKNMQNFINAADEFHRSRFKLKFNVSKTPKVYILNKEREILIKDVGAEYLGKIIDQIIEQESNAEGN